MNSRRRIVTIMHTRHIAADGARGVVNAFTIDEGIRDTRTAHWVIENRHGKDATPCSYQVMQDAHTFIAVGLASSMHQALARIEAAYARHCAS